jgi:RNA polymerase sigma-70 factor (ECF subfamily)
MYYAATSLKQIKTAANAPAPRRAPAARGKDVPMEAPTVIPKGRVAPTRGGGAVRGRVVGPKHNLDELFEGPAIDVDGPRRATSAAAPVPTVPNDGRNIAELYERHAPAIYAHCRRLLGSAPAGRDALQESFVRVLQHHRVLGPGDQALRYLYRTSTNVCINLLRQRSVRERAAPLIAAQIMAAQSHQPIPGDREFVRLLLEQCDETAVAVALMHFVDGMTQVEVAATLGITRRTVYNRIRKIEKLAADMMEPAVSAEPAARPSAR